MRDDFGPRHAPTASISGRFDVTATFVRAPGSRAIAMISTMSSWISGTWNSIRRCTSPSAARESTTSGPLFVLRTSST